MLESAWPFASFNLPGQYLRLNIGSLSRGAAAAAAVDPASQVPSQVQIYWQGDPNHFEFQCDLTNVKVEVLRKERS